MNRYEMMLTETRNAKVAINAESRQEARDRLMALYQAGEIKFQRVTEVEHEITNVNALRIEKLPRFEIFGEQAIFADMPLSEINQLAGIDKLFRYDLRHGDDDAIPLSLESRVVVNRFGTVFTMEPLLHEDEEARTITEDDWSFRSDLDDITPEQFHIEMQKEHGIMRDYEILQLKDSAREYMFMNTKELEQMGAALNADNYHAVYKGTLEPGADLESIYEMFNINRPKDFTGHSLSVSDVIVISDARGKTAYFVDSFGFTTLPDFFIVPEQQRETSDDAEKNYPSLYRHTADYARETGMIAEYRASMQENIACKQAIEEAIRMGFDGMNLKDGIAADILDRFGAERVSWVLGNTVSQLEHDGRFSYSNKVWAQAMNIPVDKDGFGHLRNWNYQVTTHPAVLDGFIDLTRKEMEKPPIQRQADRSAQSKAEKPSVREAVKSKQAVAQSEAQKKPAKRRNEQSL